MSLRRKLFAFGVLSLALAGIGYCMIQIAERRILAHVWAK